MIDPNILKKTAGKSQSRNLIPVVWFFQLTLEPKKETVQAISNVISQLVKHPKPLERHSKTIIGRGEGKIDNRPRVIPHPKSTPTAVQSTRWTELLGFPRSGNAQRRNKSSNRATNGWGILYQDFIHCRDGQVDWSILCVKLSGTFFFLGQVEVCSCVSQDSDNSACQLYPSTLRPQTFHNWQFHALPSWLIHKFGWLPDMFLRLLLSSLRNHYKVT